MRREERSYINLKKSAGGKIEGIKSRHWDKLKDNKWLE